MVLRQPSYKLILVFLSGALITIPIALLQNGNQSLGNLLQLLLYSIFLLALGVVPSLLLFWYWKVTKTIIEENTKIITLIEYRFHFFKIREFKFNGKEVQLELARIYVPGEGQGYLWKLYLCHPASGARFLIMESVLAFILVRKVKEIQAILNCRLVNPYEKKTQPKGCVS